MRLEDVHWRTATISVHRCSESLNLHSPPNAPRGLHLFSDSFCYSQACRQSGDTNPAVGRPHLASQLCFAAGGSPSATSGAEQYPGSPGSGIDLGLYPCREYLTELCGLSAATRFYRRRYAREFLKWRFEGKRWDLTKLCFTDFVDYVKFRAPRLKPASVGVMMFLEFEGRCRSGLSQAWPTVPNWKQSPP